MEFVELEKTRGTLETLMILLKEGDKRPTHLIKSISPSADTFYTVVKKLKEYSLIKKQYDEPQDALVWVLIAHITQNIMLQFHPQGQCFLSCLVPHEWFFSYGHQVQ